MKNTWIGAKRPRRVWIAKATSLTALLCLTSACATTYTKTRYVIEPLTPTEFRQTEGGVQVENHNVSHIPRQFIVQAQKCSGSSLVVDSEGRAVMENALLVDPRRGEAFYDISVSNNSDHVIRLNTAVFRLFDPAGNQHEPLSKNDLGLQIMQMRPCGSSVELAGRVNTLKMVDRNVELVPGTSFRGFMVFSVGTRALQLTGAWKLGLYEIPVETDAAGSVVKTVKFEVRTVSTKFVDTYYRKSMFASPVLAGTEEIR